MAISRCDCAGLRILLGLALLITTWAALTPAPLALPDAPLADKWVHLAAFVALSFLVDASWPERTFDLPKGGFLLGYGVLLELAQSQVPGRMFSLADILADLAGIALYAVVLRRALRAAGVR